MKTVETAGLIATSFRSLANFDLRRPSSPEQALALALEGPSAEFIAGGTDLVAQFNEGWSAKRLIDLSRLRSLRGIRREGNSLSIGALVTHWEGARDPLLRAVLPGFAAAWARIANVRVRMAATIGGNLMARRTRYEMPVLLSAIGAQLEILDRRGVHHIPVQHFLKNPINAPIVLKRVLLPLVDEARYDYERGLRPIATQALHIWQERQGTLRGRLALATEHVMPSVVEMPMPDGLTWGELASQAERIAQASISGLPLELGDPVSGSAYLRQAAAAQLTRQLSRIGQKDRP